MKILEWNWLELFAQLPDWEALSDNRRQLLIDISRGSGGSYRTKQTAGMADLIDRGWLQPALTTHEPRLIVPQPRRFLLRALRALDDVRYSGQSAIHDRRRSNDVLSNYLLHHYTMQEIAALSRRDADSRRDQLAVEMHEVDWLRQFLEWQGEPGSGPPPLVFHHYDRWRQARPAAVATARKLIETVAQRGAPTALTELVEAADRGGHRAALAAGLAFACGEALLLTSVDATMLPFIGVWLPALERLHRGRTAAPESARFSGEEVVCRTLLLEDLATLLIEAIVEPPRLKAGGGALYARARTALGARLAVLPAWVGRAGTRLSNETRILRATSFAQLLELAEARVGPGNNRRLMVTDRGQRWLLLDAKHRLQRILDSLRRDALERPRYAYDEEEVYLSYVPLLRELDEIWYDRRVDAGVTDAFRTVGRDAILDLEAFIRFHCEERNPLLEDDPGTLRYGGRDRAERIWGAILTAFFYERLISLGGAALGPLAGGAVGFRLTDIGRYLLGEVDDFTLDAPAKTGAAIVQPNFEIVFLGPSPIDQVRARSFAAPTPALKGPDAVGTLFVITRESVHRAVMAGHAAKQIVATAGDLSQQPLPPNVQRQIEDWAAGVRRVDMRPAVVLDCHDAETALRVLGALGKHGRRLSDSAVELVGRSELPAAVRRKLVAQGVFVRSTGELPRAAGRDG